MTAQKWAEQGGHQQIDYMGGKALRPKPYTNDNRQLNTAGSRGSCYPREESYY